MRSTRCSSKQRDPPQVRNVENRNGVEHSVRSRRARRDTEHSAEILCVRDYEQQVPLPSARRSADLKVDAVVIEELSKSRIQIDSIPAQPARSLDALEHRNVESESAAVEEKTIFDFPDIDSCVARLDRQSRQSRYVRPVGAECLREVIPGSSRQNRQSSVRTRLQNRISNMRRRPIAADNYESRAALRDG